MSFRVRTLWFYLGVSAVVCGAGSEIRGVFAELTAPALGVAIVLTFLLCTWPCRALAARRDAAAPLWWNLSVYAVLGVAVFGAVMFDAEMVAAAYIPLAGLSLTIALGCLAVELRHPVRVYSTANAIQFVKRDGAP